MKFILDSGKEVELDLTENELMYLHLKINNMFKPVKPLCEDVLLKIPEWHPSFNAKFN